jgi:hypothetical protein
VVPSKNTFNLYFVATKKILEEIMKWIKSFFKYNSN